MQKLNDYITKEGWKKDWDNTKRDLGYLFALRKTDRADDLKKNQGDYAGNFTFLEKLANNAEAVFGDKDLAKWVPTYRFITYPLYKLMGGKKRPILATITPFAAHTFALDPNIISHLVNGNLDFFDYCNMAWLAGGCLVAYAKVKRKDRELERVNELKIDNENDLEKLFYGIKNASTCRGYCLQDINQQVRQRQ